MSRDGEGHRRAANGPAPGNSSPYAILRGLQGMAVRLLYLALATPDHPVSQVNGVIEEVRPNGLVVSVERKLPHLEGHIRFGLEIFAPAGLVNFQVRLVEPVVEGSESLFLALPKTVETVQRRRFARVPFSGDITFQHVHAGKPLLKTGEATGVDLSAGGLKMVTSSMLRPDQELLVSFQTPDGRTYRGIATRVLRVERVAGKYAAACRFERLSEAQEEALVQSVFRIQVRSASH